MQHQAPGADGTSAALYAEQLHQIAHEAERKPPVPAIEPPKLEVDSVAAAKPPPLALSARAPGGAPTFNSARRALTARPASAGRGAPSPRPATARSSGDPLLGCGYVTLSPIANGAFSQVSRARHLATQREVATKTFHKAKYLQPGNAHLAQAMRNEIDVLRRLQPANHPHVANILEVVETPSAYIAVLEYCAGGSLHRLLQKSGACDRPHALGLGEERASSIGYMLASALAHMHGLGIAHRDVKPENVLFVRSDLREIKLCDFGFSVACGSKRLRTVCGTPQYMAPEIEAGASLTRGGGREPYHGWAADMWAYGALVFECLEGKPAFRGASNQQLNMRIVRASHEAFSAATPPPARHLIKKLLLVEPTARMPARGVLAHGWLAPYRKREAAEMAAETAQHAHYATPRDAASEPIEVR